jgi:hypothetical protein
MARLSVDVPCSTLRALKIRAIENGKTVREYVLAMLERDGLLYPLHEPRSSRSAQRAAFCAHDGKRDEVVGARSRVEGERAEGEGIRGGARVQGIHVGVLGQLPEARTDR